MRDSGQPKAMRRSLIVFLILLVFFFLRFWIVSSYHPFQNPALFALVFASIAAIVESTREDSSEDSKQKKRRRKGPAPLSETTREMRSGEKGKLGSAKS